MSNTEPPVEDEAVFLVELRSKSGLVELEVLAAVRREEVVPVVITCAGVGSAPSELPKIMESSERRQKLSLVDLELVQVVFAGSLGGTGVSAVNNPIG